MNLQEPCMWSEANKNITTINMNEEDKRKKGKEEWNKIFDLMQDILKQVFLSIKFIYKKGPLPHN